MRTYCSERTLKHIAFTSCADLSKGLIVVLGYADSMQSQQLISINIKCTVAMMTLRVLFYTCKRIKRKSHIFTVSLNYLTQI